MLAGESSEVRVAIPRGINPDFLAARASDAGSLFVLEGETMGTTWKLHFRCPPQFSREKVRGIVEEELALVIRQMSHYAEDSELTRFNQAPAGRWQKLSPEFFTVLHRALAIARITGGRYDPTLGQISRRNGFGPEMHEAPVRKNPPGWAALQLADDRLEARHEGQCFLDLSSIAKGYALDLIGESLERRGVLNYLFEIGGEFRGSGIKPDGQPWWVDLDPFRGSHAGHPVIRVALCGVSLATSGTAVQSIVEGGQLRHHLIDPRTGSSVESDLRAVSVLASSCLEADAWATALFLMGPEDGLALAANRGIAAYFVIADGAGVREVSTPAFSELFED
ncbi:MAG: FAD:protein FMN transferase [Verrucomicrobiota bacterium JB023]|nr:FAD:protein FMN transferase [Verrucomicrobiota bacterium JB023]